MRRWWEGMVCKYKQDISRCVVVVVVAAARVERSVTREQCEKTPQVMLWAHLFGAVLLASFSTVFTKYRTVVLFGASFCDQATTSKDSKPTFFTCHHIPLHAARHLAYGPFLLHYIIICCAVCDSRFSFPCLLYFYSNVTALPSPF